jgi:hypothetical protein
MQEISLKIGPTTIDQPITPIWGIISTPTATSNVIEISDKITDKKLWAHVSPRDGTSSWINLILPSCPAKTSWDFTGDLSQNQVNLPSAVTLKQVDDKTIAIHLFGQQISQLHYNKFELANRPCLYPMISPSGIGITRNYPMGIGEKEREDHPHHTGIWTAWGRVGWTDNWAFGPRCGRQIVQDVKIATNPIFGNIILTLSWINTRGKPQLAETREITIYAIDNPYIIDFTIRLRALGRVTLGDTKEGGFLSLRVATPMDVPRGGKIENSRGQMSTDDTTESNVWGQRAEWCDYSGTVEGKAIGVAIFDHTNNYNFPTYWHVRNYGLMSANPLGLSYFLGRGHNGSLDLKKQQEIVFRYRLIVHDGDAKVGQIEQQYAVYNTFEPNK